MTANPTGNSRAAQHKRQPAHRTNLLERFFRFSRNKQL